MSTNIRETINRLRELDKTASPVPWWVGHPEGLHYGILSEDIDYTALVIDAYCGGERIDRNTPDLEIIVETRNAIPVLLAEIDRLQGAEKELKERFALIFSKWRSRRQDLIRRVQAEARAEGWAEGYQDKEAEAGGVMIHSEPRERAKNPYKEEK